MCTCTGEGERERENKLGVKEAELFFVIFFYSGRGEVKKYIIRIDRGA